MSSSIPPPGKNALRENNGLANGAAAKRGPPGLVGDKPAKRLRTVKHPPHGRTFEIQDVSVNARIVYMASEEIIKYKRKNSHAYPACRTLEYPIEVNELRNGLRRTAAEISLACDELREVGLMVEMDKLKDFYHVVPLIEWWEQQKHKAASLQIAAALSKAPDEFQLVARAAVTRLGESGLPAGPEGHDERNVGHELFSDTLIGLDCMDSDDSEAEEDEKEMDNIVTCVKHLRSHWQTPEEEKAARSARHERRIQRDPFVVDRVRKLIRPYGRRQLAPNPLPSVSEPAKRVYGALQGFVKRYHPLQEVSEVTVAHVLKISRARVHQCYLELGKSGLIVNRYPSDTKTCLPVPLDMWREQRRLEDERHRREWQAARGARDVLSLGDSSDAE
ncbi:hypothetical protein LTR56_004972 [Elasticomyces elasticus]|nr:hypothetical protein LTR22_015787 [Elasticomyces elasticus]KAK3652678.1 hypothetical protein LTR56_004972 [Elasticomyces elasticus]KAK4914608.1 hypothetical protein LTR49_017175 [Elasticomyces elasticus]KAK5753974.1 hypothetical protein LTS12_015940 [Elasticomyces elasticus]